MNTEYLIKVAEQLNTSTDHVYSILSKQAFIDGLGALIWVALGVFILYTMSKKVKIQFEKFQNILDNIKQLETTKVKPSELDDYHDNMRRLNKEKESKAFDTALFLAFAAIGFIIIWGNLGTAITGILNPQWYVIMDAVDFVKHLR